MEGSGEWGWQSRCLALVLLCDVSLLLLLSLLLSLLLLHSLTLTLPLTRRLDHSLGDPGAVYSRGSAWAGCNRAGRDWIGKDR